MAPNPSAAAAKAVIDGKLRLLKKMASKVDLREVKDPKVGNLLHLAAARGTRRSAGSWWRNRGSMSTAPTPMVRRL
ncbi:unnamed protein product [Urochloa humidicola]